MERKQNIEEHLKRSLEDLEIQPNMRSFHEVMRKMEEKKKRRRFIVFFWFGILLLSASAISLYYTFSNQKEIVLNQSSAKIASPNTKETTLLKEKLNKLLKQDASIITNTEKRLNPVVTSITPEINSKTNNTTLNTTYSNTNKSKGSSNINNADSKKINQVVTIKNTEPSINEKLQLTKNAGAQNDDLLFLPSIKSSLTIDTTQKRIIFISQDTIEQPSISINDSINDKKKKVRFYIGLSNDLRLYNYLYSKNSHSNPVYKDGDDFAGQYLEGRKNKSPFYFNYAFGLKAGLNIHEKYEVFLGFGFQKYKQKEDLYNYGPILKKPTTPTSHYDYAFADMAEGGDNISNFNYQYYSLEVNRIYKLSRKIKYKLGIGMQANQLKTSSFIFVSAPNVYYATTKKYHPISSWTYTGNLRSGLLFDAGKRWQFQLCPTVFYSPKSIFKKDYVIKENPYGFSLECLVLFRLF